MSDYDRYLDAFGRTLAAAEPAPAPARHLTALLRRRPVAFAGLAAALAAAVTALLLALPGGSGGRLDVLAQARAALTTSQGQIVHIVLTRTVRSPGAHAVPPPSTTQQWSAADPPRWRLVQDIPKPGSGRGTVGDREGSFYGRQEFAYGAGAQDSYVARRDQLSVSRGFSDDGQAAKVPSLIGGNPVDELRALLDRGALHDGGVTRVDGRDVRRLVGTERSKQLTRTTTYDVDATTLVPVSARFTITFGGRPGRHGISLTTLVHVDRYERLPLTPATAKLLTIAVGPATEVILRATPRARPQRLGSRRACGPGLGPVRCS